MDLPNLFSSSKKKNPDQLFLALAVGREAITAGLWTTKNGHVELLKTSSPIEWRGDQASDAAEAADVAIEELGEQGSKTDDVMFGLQDDWVDEFGMKASKKPILKTITEQLTLHPLGYVVETEALVQYIGNLEGGPLTAILIVYTTASLRVVIVKAGVIEKNEVVGRSGDAIADLSEGFARFSLEQLPSRMILCAERMKAEELEQEKQTLLAHDWKKAFPFFHIPKVDVLPPAALVTAVCIAGGTEVASSLGYVEKGEEAQKTMPLHAQEHDLEKEPPLEKENDKEDDKENVAMKEEVDSVQKEEKSGEAEVPSDPADFGFSELPVHAAIQPVAEAGSPLVRSTGAPVHRGAFVTEIAEDQPEKKEHVEQDKLKSESKEHDADGDQIDRIDESLPKNEQTIAQRDIESDSTSEEKNPVYLKTPSRPIFAPFVQLIKNVFGGRSLEDKFESDITGKRKKRIAMLLILTFVIALGLVSVFLIKRTTTADLTLILAPTTVSKDFELLFNPEKNELTYGEKAIPTQVVEEEITGEKTKSSTGKNTVGDRAKGTVTIYNRTTGTKMFPSNTVVTTANGLKFTLDEDVMVASSSAGADYSLKPGKAEVNVTAAKIGAEYNIGSNMELTVANFDKMSYVATTNAAFDGGTSREIQAVSKADVTELEKQLLEELKQQAVEKAKQQQEGDTQVISTGKVAVKEKKISNDVGTEAKEVSMSMTIQVTHVAFQRADVLSFAEEKLKEQLPAQTKLLQEKTSMSSQQVEQLENGTVKMKVSVTSAVEPTMDSEKLKLQLKGKTTEQVSTFLDTYNEISMFRLVIAPKLSKVLFDKMPDDVSRIRIETRLQ